MLVASFLVDVLTALLDPRVRIGDDERRVYMELTLKEKRSASSSLMKKNIRKFLNNRLAMIGLIFMLILLFMCVFAPLFTSYDAETVDFTAMRRLPAESIYSGRTDWEETSLPESSMEAGFLFW